VLYRLTITYGIYQCQPFCQLSQSNSYWSADSPYLLQNFRAVDARLAFALQSRDERLISIYTRKAPPEKFVVAGHCATACELIGEDDTPTYRTTADFLL